MATSPSEGAPSSPEQSLQNQHRASLGFLRRAKSTEPLAENRKSFARKRMSKAQMMEEEMRRQRESYAPKVPPRLPDLSPTPQLETFGGEDGTPWESRGPFLALTLAFPSRSESMTHRGRYSYASSALSTVNSPRRVRRRKDPTPYNVLVVGARNSGKTEFLNFLRKALTMPAHKHPTRTPEELEELQHQTSTYEGFTSQYLETEIDGERVGLTLWDSNGLERNIVDLQMRGVTGFLESKFEETLAEEMKVVRSPGARDTHIHCTFLLLDPVRLDENFAAAERARNGKRKETDTPVTGILDHHLDLDVLRTMLGKTTVVPVISKADTITSAHMSYLRKAVWESLKEANLDPLEILTLEDPEEEEEYTDSESVEDEDVQEEADPTGLTEPETTANAETKGAKEESEAPKESEAEAKDGDAEEPKKAKEEEAEAKEVKTEQPAPAQEVPESPKAAPANPHPLGRRFPWGFADPYNAEHCDFVRLKDSVFQEWRSELREASRVIWYERWRTNRLKSNGQPAPAPRQTYGGRLGPSRDGRRTR
ncbi:hypothetical protein N7470_005143 [Penicillium chermesinum]|nr:hypothetical protein N7470_005143 [Penicillium chermesinum]